MARLTAVSTTQKSRHYNQGTPLQEIAARLFPDSAFNQAAWTAAVAYLRSRSLWVLDGGTPTTRY